VTELEYESDEELKHVKSEPHKWAEFVNLKQFLDYEESLISDEEITLTPEELARNTHHTTIRYIYRPEHEPLKSQLSTIPDIPICHTFTEPLEIPPASHFAPKGQTQSYDFPSFSYLEHSTRLAKLNNSESRFQFPSLVIPILEECNQDWMYAFLSSTYEIYIDYPFQREY
jgi:hypothetical protein